VLIACDEPAPNTQNLDLSQARLRQRYSEVMTKRINETA